MVETPGLTRASTLTSLSNFSNPLIFPNTPPAPVSAPSFPLIIFHNSTCKCSLRISTFVLENFTIPILNRLVLLFKSLLLLVIPVSSYLVLLIIFLLFVIFLLINYYPSLNY